MILSLIIFSTLMISSLIIFRQLTSKKKYQNPTYLSNLQQIYLFFDLILGFDDYVTWVQQNQIKKQFYSVIKYFKYKSNYYKK